MNPRYFGHPLSPVDDPEAPLWCADFDSDLLRVVPGVVEALGDVVSRRLWTRCRPSNGKINHPAAWNTQDGLTAFFTTHEDRDPVPSAGYVTSGADEITECTLLDAIRDEWVHDCAIVVDGHLIWQPRQHDQLALMYDLRGWTVLSDDEREQVRENVLLSVRAAADDFRALFGTTEATVHA